MLFPFDNSYARLPREFFVSTAPTPVSQPQMIRLNRQLATDLGLDLARLDSDEGLQILAGNQLAEGSQPLAMAYSGHQFGGFSPQLGDGRAILLGEVVAKDGVRFDIQLKGSGATPFSRRGDGRSALGPVLREYIVSEAMAALGVPTTRALAAVASGERVLRDGYKPGGVFTRVARSHIRVGTFQWFAARQDHDNLKTLADYVIQRLYPHVQHDENPYLSLLESVIERQAKLIAHWMQIGFIHGVMNTDNMNVSGETIDYGPCAFMDAFDPLKTFSSIDTQGRYAYANQASMAHWNVTRFAETLLPLLDSDQELAIAKARAALDTFSNHHQSEVNLRFTAKIGIEAGDAKDLELVETLLAAMAAGNADFTLVFRHLPDALSSAGEGDNDGEMDGEGVRQVVDLFDQPQAIRAWLATWRARLPHSEHKAAIDLMRRTNPTIIPRNHRIEAVIQAAEAGDFAPFHQLNELLQRPFSVSAATVEFEAPPRPSEIVQATFCGT